MQNLLARPARNYDGSAKSPCLAHVRATAARAKMNGCVRARLAFSPQILQSVAGFNDEAY